MCGGVAGALGRARKYAGRACARVGLPRGGNVGPVPALIGERHEGAGCLFIHMENSVVKRSLQIGSVVMMTMLGTGATVLALQPERPAGQPGNQQGGQPGQQGQPGGPPGERGPRGPGGPGGVISVEQAMRSMNRPVRQLRGQIGDATKRDENLRMINEMQRGCVAAKGLPAPEGVLANLADDAAKAETNEHYRRDLIKALRILVDMEVAVMDGKGDEASKKLDELIAARDKAHEEMGIKDDE